MQGQSRILEIYMMSDGRQPYLEWLETLKDKVTKARILNGVTKMEMGNFGVSEGVGGSVIELKLDFGPGYRVYYALEDEKILLLLLAGAKNSQKKDIQQAKEYLHDFRSRNNDE